MFLMSNTESLQLFEDQPIRSAWDEEAEEWYFSIVDVVGVLTEQPDARHASTYWAVLKKRLNEEGASELLTNCKQLKLKASDGKRRSTDVANTEQLLRIIQSIPSKKAEPFKLWLAQVGRERIEETLDPELIVDRLVSTYERRGYTREWINQRRFRPSAPERSSPTSGKTVAFSRVRSMRFSQTSSLAPGPV